MLATTVAAICVAVPTGAAADQWTEDTTPWLAYSGPAHAGGQLSWTMSGSGVVTTCDVTGSFGLTNSAFAPHKANGNVASLTMSGCTTTLASCAVTGTAGTLPWPISTLGDSVTISSTRFSLTYSGGGCALGGLTVIATGTVNGWLPSTTVLVNGDYLGTNLGLVWVTGSINLRVPYWTGAPDPSRRITLS